MTYKQYEVEIKDGMIVGCENFGIWCILEGKKRKVPDLHTRIQMGISMDWVVMLPPREFHAIPEGEPMPTIKPLRVGGRRNPWEPK